MALMANPRVIDWAIRRCGLTPQDLKSISPKVQDWVNGTAEPTTKQLARLAERTHVLLPYFYEQEPPTLGLQIPDFRTLRPGSAASPSPELYDTINQMLTRQDWLSGYLEFSGAKSLHFIGKFSKQDDPKACASEVCRLLSLEEGWASSIRPDEAVRSLRKAIEANGVYTCFGSYVGNSTARTYRVEEFRGFVLADQYAPIIFVNAKDSKSAQLFTLVHEFAHLLCNESGVDDVEYEDPQKESFCNAVAAEVLIPATFVYRVYDNYTHADAVEAMKSNTKASEVACLRRARDLGCITTDEFFSRYKAYASRAKKETKPTRKPGSGPRFYQMQKSKLGELFPETVFMALKAEYLMYPDAYDLTGMKASSFAEFYRREGLFV